MDESKTWVSPDNKIKKRIIKNGYFGPKPTENAVCDVIISDVSEDCSSEYLENMENLKIIIGEANTAIDREIDKLLLTMFRNELSEITLNLENEINFVIKLLGFESKGIIYNWPAEEKCKLALNHKECGVKLYREGRHKDASHRFSRGLKLLLSIPIPVDEKKENIEKVDDVTIPELESCKVNLLNNLASCYAKENNHDNVIDLCNRILEMDMENLKALTKRGTAYADNRDFERAKNDFTKILEIDGNNKTVIDKLFFVNNHIKKQSIDCDNMVKKMFGR